MLHFFDPEIAVQYGVDEAVFIQNLRYWIQRNEADETNFYEGKYWVYNSQRAWPKFFPYWTRKQIRRIVEKLRDLGVIEVGCFNESPYDRTAWYTLRSDFLLKEIPPKEPPGDAKKGVSGGPMGAQTRAQVGPPLILNNDSNKNIVAARPDGADAPVSLQNPEPSKTHDFKKDTVTIADLVAEGVNEDHARDWLTVRGKKGLTPSAWKRLKSDAENYKGTPAEAVQICAERGWQGLGHAGAENAFQELKADKTASKHWQPEDPNKICISPTGEKWFKGRRVI